MIGVEINALQVTEALVRHDDGLYSIIMTAIAFDYLLPSFLPGLLWLAVLSPLSLVLSLVSHVLVNDDLYDEFKNKKKRNKQTKVARSRAESSVEIYI